MITVNLLIDELPILLNNLANITLYSAIPRHDWCQKDRQLLHIKWDKPRPEVKLAYAQGTLKKWRDKLARIDSHWVEDALRDALLSSGILLPPNYSKILAALKPYTKPPSKEDPRIKAIAIDTNILYNMFLTTLSEDDIKPYKLLVSRCVLEEIARAANNPHVDKASYTPEGSRLRRAWGAHYEWLRYKEKAEKIGGNGCRGDETIISHYSQIPGDYDPILITFDDKSLSHATARGIPNAYIETPQLPPSGTTLRTTHPRVQRLIYSLVLAYGAITLKPSDSKLGEACVKTKSFHRASQGKISVTVNSTAPIALELSLLDTYRKINEILRETRAPS